MQDSNRNDVLLSGSEMLSSSVEKMTDPKIVTSQTLLHSALQNTSNASLLDAQQMTTCDSPYQASLKMFQLTQHLSNLQQHVYPDALKTYWQHALLKYPSLITNDPRNIRLPNSNMSNAHVTPEISPYMCHLPLSIPMECYGIRRKNATRETTSALKLWLNDHQKNPYPTKNEKIMLSYYTKMSMTQVSTWFANARRRLKKENKMTWAPRSNKPSDSDESDGDALSDVNDEEICQKTDQSNTSDNIRESLEYETRKRNYDSISVDADEHSLIKMTRESFSSEGIREDSEYNERDLPYNLRSSHHVERKRKCSFDNSEQIDKPTGEIKKPKIWSIPSEIDEEGNLRKRNKSNESLPKSFITIPSTSFTIPPFMQSFQSNMTSNQLSTNTYLHRPNFLFPYPFHNHSQNSMISNFHNSGNSIYNTPMLMSSHYPILQNSFESMPMFLPMMNLCHQNTAKDTVISDREITSHNLCPQTLLNGNIKSEIDDKLSLSLGTNVSILKEETSVNVPQNVCPSTILNEEIETQNSLLLGTNDNGSQIENSALTIQNNNASETPDKVIESNLKAITKMSYDLKADEGFINKLQTKLNEIKSEPANLNDSSVDAESILTEPLHNESTTRVIGILESKNVKTKEE